MAMLRISTLNRIILVCLAASSQLFAQEAEPEDCELAERYYGFAQDRIKAKKIDAAQTYLERAGSACARHAYFQELGELQMTSVDQETRRLAVDSFIEAYALASSDEQRARALWKYAELLNREGDPQNADRLIREARRLDQSNPDIAALAEDVQDQIENPTRDQFIRGLAESLYKPIRLAAAASQPAGAGTSVSHQVNPILGDERASIRIPIHFEFNSTSVDPATRRNVQLLAEALSDEKFKEQNFRFVGHSDVRGDPQYNLELSVQRAYAVYNSIIEIDSSLEGRIRVSGLGESEPLAFGDSEQAHRTNRRLQVFLQ
jgi:outer membrane protein OmpA-like peptidoglycan-associated protein